MSNNPLLNDAAALDARIVRAEQRLLDHQAQLHHDLHALSQRVRDAAAPRHWALPALAGVALMLVWRARRRRHAARPAPTVSPPQHAAAPARIGAALWLTQLSSLAWPLLAAVWRERAPAGMAAVIGAARRNDTGLPRPVSAVDLQRFAGTWYEVARLRTRFDADCAGQPSVTYVQRGDHLDVISRCPTRDGGERVAHGEARVERGSRGARLSVSFAPRWLRALPFAWSDRWLLHVEDDYSAALVGSPGRRHLWLLARERELPQHVLVHMLRAARIQGFELGDLVWSERAERLERAERA